MAYEAKHLPLSQRKPLSARLCFLEASAQARDNLGKNETSKRAFENIEDNLYSRTKDKDEDNQIPLGEYLDLVIGDLVSQAKIHFKYDNDGSIQSLMTDAKEIFNSIRCNSCMKDLQPI